MTEAAHNQHSDTRRPSDRDRIVRTGPIRFQPAPICAISLTGASRSRRAANESCNVAGMARGGNGRFLKRFAVVGCG
jgi:hypothetical protein